MSYEYDSYQWYEYPKRDKSKLVLSITVIILVIFLALILFQYSTLLSEYQELYSEAYSLKSEKNSLLLLVNRLEGEISSLKESYDTLLLRYQTSETLRINHLIADYYDEVRSLAGAPFRRNRGSNYFEQVKFMAELARHSLGRAQWPVLEGRFYEVSGEQSYIMAMRKMGEVFRLIDIRDTDNYVRKVEKILKFIKSNIHYVKDYDNVFLAPLETLTFRSGDCDDYAILAASLFEMAGIPSAIGIFTNGTADHAMVLLRLDSLSPYGFHYYQDLTNIGLSPGKWILIEPQVTIEWQYDPKWFNQWKLQAAVEV
ncbi:MAG: transglutaminase-like domain-containing protein [Crenarchaeota archaeon]|nr:transglutaminase-like domain-containing protein [Thermoproteota archaeon]MDW8034120.1 transglutaminase-like domain-containing protein [Nitrososphaerota archaeon]